MFYVHRLGLPNAVTPSNGLTLYLIRPVIRRSKRRQDDNMIRTDQVQTTSHGLQRQEQHIQSTFLKLFDMVLANVSVTLDLSAPEPLGT